MAPFPIHDSDLQPLKDKIVVITGSSSGIGLGTVQLLLSLGAKVVAGDINPPPVDNAGLTFLKCNVTKWADLKSLFALALEKHGKIDHVFANAGIAGALNYTEDEFDEQGELKEPSHDVVHVNMIGVMNTVKLGVHHLKKNERGGSIVITASTAAVQRFRSVEYTVKHGVLGLMRGLAAHLHPNLPIRINAIAPSWTDTGLIPKAAIKAVGIPLQTPHDVARSVAILMADEKRNQQLVYSVTGVYTEVEQDLMDAFDRIRPKETGEDEDMARIVEHLQKEAASAQAE